MSTVTTTTATTRTRKPKVEAPSVEDAPAVVNPDGTPTEATLVALTGSPEPKAKSAARTEAKPTVVKPEPQPKPEPVQCRELRRDAKPCLGVAVEDGRCQFHARVAKGEAKAPVMRRTQVERFVAWVAANPLTDADRQAIAKAIAA